MEIVTYKPKEFEGYKIFVRRIGTYFEYITVIGGMLYSSHKIVRPTLIGWLLHKIWLRKDVFDHDQIIYIQKYLETLAMGTIRELTKPKSEVLK